jgi:hypothetical protein
MCNTYLLYCDEPGDCIQNNMFCILYVSYLKCAENTFIIEESTTLSNRKKSGSVIVLLNSWNVPRYYMNLFWEMFPISN